MCICRTETYIFIIASVYTCNFHKKLAWLLPDSVLDFENNAEKVKFVDGTLHRFTFYIDRVAFRHLIS